MLSDRKLLLAYYRAMLRQAGHRQWWPGRTRWEIILGAILTQNTSWGNVERALASLRTTGILPLVRLRAVPETRLALAIRPSGYFRQKARKIRAFLDLLDRGYGGSLERMARAPTPVLRAQLLSTWGIGPETADSILLYAFRRPVFVVDAYTRRILSRHALVSADSSYGEIQEFLRERLPESVDLFNDYHAQLVWVGHHHCRTSPRCEGCSLRPFLPHRESGPQDAIPGNRRGIRRYEGTRFPSPARGSCGSVGDVRFL